MVYGKPLETKGILDSQNTKENILKEDFKDWSRFELRLRMGP